MSVICPHCGSTIANLDIEDTEQIDCPSCGESFNISESQIAAEASPELEPPDPDDPAFEKTVIQYSELERFCSNLETDSSETDDEPPPFGGYMIEREIGRGGMGVIYKARQVGLDRIVALKTIRDSTLASPEAVRRFRAEAEAVAKLNHPGIVQIYDVGAVDGSHFFSMEFMEGGDLSKLVGDGPLSNRRAAELVKSIAEAIQFAHIRKIVHRDLKPPNVLVNADGLPMVTDFGLAKNMESDSGETSTNILGTPEYLSPEQAAGRNDEVGPLADVYALGGLLYFLLTGKPPFKGTSALETIKLVIDSEPVPVEKLNPHVDKNLSTICLKCLNKDMRHRYASAQELADDLGRWLKKLPILARPVSLPERAWLWCRRSPRRAIISAVILLMVVTTLGAGIALQITRGNLANSYFGQAELAMTRGQLTKALELFNKAEDAGHDDRVGIMLKKADAWEGLGRLDRVSSLVSELQQRADLGPHQGKVSLWQAELRLWKNWTDEEAITLFESALETGLPPAEQLYVRGMLAEDSREALEYFEKALEIDKFHSRSMRMAINMQILLGQRSRAERRLALYSQLFPENVTTQLLQAIVLSINGDREAAQDIIDSQAEGLTAPESHQFRDLIDVACSLSESFTFLPDQPRPDISAQSRNILQLLLKGSQAFPEQGFGIHLPPRIAQRFRGLSLWLLQGIYLAQFQSLAEKLETILEVNPEGTLQLLHGHLLFAQQRFQDAAESYEKAVQTPALFRNVERESKIMLAFCKAYHAVIIDKEDQESLDDAIALIKEVINGGPLPSDAYQVYAVAAIRAKDYPLARRVLLEWEQAVDDEPEPLLRRWMQVEFEDQAYSKAMYYADKLLKIDPNHEEAKRIFQESTEKLNKANQ